MSSTISFLRTFIVDSIRLKLSCRSLGRSSDVEKRSWKARVHESANRTRDDALPVPYRFQLHVVLFISKASILVCSLHRNTICMELKHCLDYNDDILVLRVNLLTNRTAPVILRATPEAIYEQQI
jgi:hypothetical protein